MSRQTCLFSQLVVNEIFTIIVTHNVNPLVGLGAMVGVGARPLLKDIFLIGCFVWSDVPFLLLSNFSKISGWGG